MVEREHGAGRPMPRPDKGVPFAEALNEVTREHHGALAALADDPEHRRQMAIGLRVLHDYRGALAESERRDREAEAGHANIRRDLAG